MFTRLKKLPGSAARTDTPLAFRDNWRLHGLQDAFTSEPVDHPSELSAYGEAELTQEAALWQDREQIQWRWTSPARLLKDKQRPPT